MGVAVSDWRLANAVARTGQLGVVSGTMLDTVIVRRLQDGDPGGHMRRAIAAFPVPEVGAEILRRYFNPNGRAPGTPYKALPMYKQRVSDARQRVTVLANFAEVWLAEQRHAGAVGINLLTKVQMPNLASLYGAMLAGVDAVIMGAGIPREIPGVLDAFADHRPAQMRFDIEGLPRDAAEYLVFDPASCTSPLLRAAPLRRPAGLDASLKSRVLTAVASGTLELRTDPRASPTGYPFKIVELPGDAERAARRTRVCDLGYLRVAVRTSDGRTIYRCSAEPVDQYVAKGGDLADTEGRRCLCNGLTAHIGQPQWRTATSTEEIPLITSGDDVLSLATFAERHPAYTAADVVKYICT